MQSFLACFACGDKNNDQVVAPETVNVTPAKPSNLNESDIKTDDNKSRISMTTVTFLTNETTPTKDQDEDEQIRRRIEVLGKKVLPERKAMQSEFVKQNLARSSVIYLIDKKWSQEYTRFLNNQKITSMPPIDNSRLLDAKGELKSGLRQKQDYFVVTEKIWKFVQGFYGGGPAIAKDYCFPVIPLSTRRVALLPVGLQNPQNLCFIIAVVQMLTSIEQLNGFILKKLYVDSNVDVKKRVFHNIYHKLLKQYSQVQSTGDQRALEIAEFASCFESKFNPRQQHDAHEFFINFVSLLQEEMKAEVPQPAKIANQPDQIYSHYFRQHRSIIDKIFAGQHQSTVVCHSCDNRSVMHSAFLEIVVSITNMRTLEQCLENYYSSEKLQDLYECQKCKKKTKATKSTCVTKTPNFLVIVLAKFKASTLRKIEDRIEYGFSLDMAKHGHGHCGETNYELHSLLIHKGAKINKGHYYTLTRRGAKNEWFYFNDHSVKKIDESEVVNRDPYILVYERARA